MPELPNSLWTVADVLQRWPQASEVFRQWQLACVGCTMAPFDTLGEVASAYGLDLPRLLDEVARAAEDSWPQD